MKIFEVFGQDAHNMTLSLMDAATVASRIQKNASIVLKPNLVLDSSPENGATTHAGVLSGCVEYLLSHGFENICIAESSWVGAKTEQSFKACGYDEVCNKYNVPFYDLKKDSVETVNTPFRPMPDEYDLCIKKSERLSARSGKTSFSFRRTDEAHRRTGVCGETGFDYCRQFMW